MRSLLFGDTLPFSVPPGCAPGRQESSVTLRKFGRNYTYVFRDKITVEDPYLVLVKAEAFAVAQGEPYAGVTTGRTERDFLIKSSVQI